jgi:hypothetical protein
MIDKLEGASILVEILRQTVKYVIQDTCCSVCSWLFFSGGDSFTRCCVFTFCLCLHIPPLLIIYLLFYTVERIFRDNFNHSIN